jgi:hypothetical protein
VNSGGEVARKCQTKHSKLFEDLCRSQQNTHSSNKLNDPSPQHTKKPHKRRNTSTYTGIENEITPIGESVDKRRRKDASLEASLASNSRYFAESMSIPDPITLIRNGINSLK